MNSKDHILVQALKYSLLVRRKANDGASSHNHPSTWKLKRVIDVKVSEARLPRLFYCESFCNTMNLRDLKKLLRYSCQESMNRISEFLRDKIGWSKKQTIKKTQDRREALKVQTAPGSRNYYVKI